MEREVSRSAQIALAIAFKWKHGAPATARRAFREIRKGKSDRYLALLGEQMLGQGSTDDIQERKKGPDECMRQLALAFRYERDCSDDALRMACAQCYAVEFDPEEHPALHLAMVFMFGVGDQSADDMLRLAMDDLRASLER